MPCRMVLPVAVCPCWLTSTGKHQSLATLYKVVAAHLQKPHGSALHITSQPTNMYVHTTGTTDSAIEPQNGMLSTHLAHTTLTQRQTFNQSEYAGVCSVATPCWSPTLGPMSMPQSGVMVARPACIAPTAVCRGRLKNCRSQIHNVTKLNAQKSASNPTLRQSRLCRQLEPVP